MNERAQFVLLAAALFAVALVPAVTAYYTLGYDADVRADGPTVTDAAERTLGDALGRSAREMPRTAWAERNRTAEWVRRNVSAAFPALRATRLAGNVSIAFAPARAERVAAERCPDGPARRFGNCTALGGVVLQNRTNRTHVVGAAVALSWVGTERNGTLSLYVPAESARGYSESRPHSSARRSASSRARS